MPDETTDEQLEAFLWFLRSRIEWDLLPRSKGAFWDVVIFRRSEGVTSRIWAKSHPAQARGARIVDRVAAYYYGRFYFRNRWSMPVLDDLGVIVDGEQVLARGTELRPEHLFIVLQILRGILDK